MHLQFPDIGGLELMRMKDLIEAKGWVTPKRGIIDIDTGHYGDLYGVVSGRDAALYVHKLAITSQSDFRLDGYRIGAKSRVNSHRRQLRRWLNRGSLRYFECFPGEDSILGSAGKACIFCGRSKPQARFKKKAHAISEGLGNKSHMFLNECDDCNANSSSYEMELLNFLLSDRVIAKIEGKGGKKSFRSSDGLIEIRPDEFGWVADVGTHLPEIMSKLDQTGILNLPAERIPFRPRGLYKSLTKFAYTYLLNEDPSRIADFEPVLNWLSKPSLELPFYIHPTRMVCKAVAYNGVFNNPSLCLLKRDFDGRSCQLIYIQLRVGFLSLQIEVPTTARLMSRVATHWNPVMLPQIRPDGSESSVIAFMQYPLDKAERTQIRTSYSARINDEDRERIVKDFQSHEAL